MSIPKKDLTYLLPIRWAFYKWMSGNSSSGWKFSEWREYLLDDSNPTEYLEDHLSDQRFLVDVSRFLKDNKVKDIGSLISFWERCCRDYEKQLEKKFFTREFLAGAWAKHYGQISSD